MSANRLKARRSRPPFVGSFKPGDTFRVECYDWKGGQIGNNDSASDVRDVNLLRVHYLSGPFRIEGAEPGNLLVVDLASSPRRTAARRWVRHRHLGDWIKR